MKDNIYGIMCSYKNVTCQVGLLLPW